MSRRSERASVVLQTGHLPDHRPVQAGDLPPALVEVHLGLDEPLSAQGGDAAVDSLDVAANEVGELTLGAAHAAVEHRLPRDEVQEHLLRPREAVLLGATSMGVAAHDGASLEVAQKVGRPRGDRRDALFT